MLAPRIGSRNGNKKKKSERERLRNKVVRSRGDGMGKEGAKSIKIKIKNNQEGGWDGRLQKEKGRRMLLSCLLLVPVPN